MFVRASRAHRAGILRLAVAAWTEARRRECESLDKGAPSDGGDTAPSPQQLRLEKQLRKAREATLEAQRGRARAEAGCAAAQASEQTVTSST